MMAPITVVFTTSGRLHEYESFIGRLKSEQFPKAVGPI